LKRRKAPGVQKIGVTNRLAVSVHQAGKTGLAHSGGPAAAAKAETSAAAARKKRRSNAPGVVVKLASAIDDTSLNVGISGQAGLWTPTSAVRPLRGNEAAATLNGLPWDVKTYPKFGVGSRDATMAGPRSAWTPHQEAWFTRESGIMSLGGHGTRTLRRNSAGVVIAA
jgi:hypothetical protein